MTLSVAVCTRNPRPDYLARVLRSLEAQTLPSRRWELLLVDNASDEPLAGRFDVAWHPRGRHVREAEMGLTMARLRAIAESRGELIVFVDDDNVLDPGYLEAAERVEREWPILGTWGGRIDPEFDVEPPEWTRPYWLLLAIRRPSRKAWSNVMGFHDATPCGAGLCVRRDVAADYAAKARRDARHRDLDRRGSSLLGAGDLDIVFTGLESGRGSGVFPELRMTHLIPPVRLTLPYLERLMEETTYSNTLLLSLYGQTSGLRPRPPWERWLRRGAGLRHARHERRMNLARMRGLERALDELDRMGPLTPDSPGATAAIRPSRPTASAPTPLPL